MNTRKGALLCSVMVLGLYGAPAWAQSAVEAEEDETELSHVIVTATRSAKAVDRIPGAVEVISTKELTQQFQIADDPSAALAASVPSFAPSRQKLSSAGETMRGRGVLIMLDGIPQGNPLRDGRREGYFVDSAVVKRIEVVSGASAIHGLGATGGIINYITRDAEEGTHHRIDVRALSQFRDDNLEWKTGYTLTHKSDLFDLVAYGSYQKRGMLYDGRGKLIGVEPSVGDTMDTHGNNIFVKVGKDFDDQRLQFTLNRFHIAGEGDYREIEGDAVNNIPTSSMRGWYDAGVAPYNKALSMTLNYANEEFLTGNLTVQVFAHNSDVLFGPDTGPAFQDIHIAPVGTLIDQGLLTDRKRGAKVTFVRPDLLMEGLELTVGADQIFDKTKQDMVVTNRHWMPLLDYQSTAPFGQLELEKGDFTFRGGLRYESGSLSVDDFQTLGYYGRLNNGWTGHTVKGGKREFSQLVKSAGGVWRFAPGFSAYASYSEGFGLPDVGILLRTVSVPNQTVDKLVSLTPIVTKSKELGLNWRGRLGSFGASVYESNSKLGSALRIGADGLGEVVRVPTRVRGLEITGELRPVRGVTLLGTYAMTRGKTAEAEGRPLDLSLGGRSQGPDKLTGAIDWNFRPGGNVRLQATKLFDRDVNIGRGGIRAGRHLLEEHFDGYVMLSLSGSLDTRFGKLGVGVENLLDKQYVGYFSQSIRYSAADANDLYIAGHGRTYSLSLTKEF